jgi:predicted metal-binding protein
MEKEKSELVGNRRMQLAHESGERLVYFKSCSVAHHTKCRVQFETFRQFGPVVNYSVKYLPVAGDA